MFMSVPLTEEINKVIKELREKHKIVIRGNSIIKLKSAIVLKSSEKAGTI